MSNLKQLCVELDDTITEFFSVHQDVLSRQHEMELVLKSGYFLMAKARYSMGAKSVGSLQYNVNDLEEASVKVDALNDKFEINSDSTSNITPRTEPNPEGLRRRVQGVQEIEKSLENMEVHNEKDCRKANRSINKKDPIHWFGILVPQTLRQSQAQFKKAIEISCELATLKARYTDLQNKYRELIQQKENLLNESLDTDILD